MSRLGHTHTKKTAGRVFVRLLNPSAGASFCVRSFRQLPVCPSGSEMGLGAERIAAGQTKIRSPWHCVQSGTDRPGMSVENKT